VAHDDSSEARVRSAKKLFYDAFQDPGDLGTGDALFARVYMAVDLVLDSWIDGPFLPRAARQGHPPT
ncbi:MAG: hypothetical protein JXO72_09560, partial [Vicinamibacteria bacterium]|nr:hypothetical protein [Vicinamibacteria bacterium]